MVIINSLATEHEKLNNSIINQNEIVNFRFVVPSNNLQEIASKVSSFLVNSKSTNSLIDTIYPQSIGIDICNQNKNIFEKSWSKTDNKKEKIEKKDEIANKSKIDKLTKQTTTTITEVIRSISSDYNNNNNNSLSESKMFINSNNKK